MLLHLTHTQNSSICLNFTGLFSILIKKMHIYWLPDECALDPSLGWLHYASEQAHLQFIWVKTEQAGSHVQVKA